jgi:hypothetical protein
MTRYATKPNGRRLTPHEASLLEVLFSENPGWTTPRRIWERAGTLPSCAYGILDTFIASGLVETQVSTFVNGAGASVPEFRLTGPGRIWYRSQMQKPIAPFPFWLMRVIGSNEPATR